jgi:[NiFe] hydrogenase assembly HybE family chaperone
MNATFEGGYQPGQGSRLQADTALECGICWHVYDPTVGDDVAQIAPGTPFALLPDSWCCPNCEAPKSKFMALGAAQGEAAQSDAAARLVGAYRKIALSMHGLPIYNPQLVVEAVQFREHAGRQVGIVLTPWFMNIVAVATAADRESWQSGATVRLGFPSGEYDFIVGEIEEFGWLASCSLFSPMNDFADHAAARAAAESAGGALFEPDPDEAPQVATSAAVAPDDNATPGKPVSRRALLGATP